MEEQRDALTLLVKQRGQNLVTASVAYCVIIGSIFDVNQPNLVNLFYYRNVITIAKLKIWTPCINSKSLLMLCEQATCLAVRRHICERKAIYTIGFRSRFLFIYETIAQCCKYNVVHVKIPF